jgi:predicted MPP superfamily phosphohydrolase
MLSAFLLIIVLVVGLVHWYLWGRLVRDTTRPGRWRHAGTALTIVLGTLPVATIAGRVLPLEQQRVLAWPGYLWLSVMFLAFCALLVLELPRFALRRWWAGRPRSAEVAEPAPARIGAAAGGDPAGAVSAGGGAGTSGTGPGSAETAGTAGPESDAGAAADPSRRLLLARSLAVVAGLTAVGTTGFGAHTALGPPRLARRQITLRKLPRGMDGFRIAVVADIHLGPFLGRAHTQRIVDTINRLDADVVTVVGDLVDGSVAELGHAAEPLSQLRGRHGSFFVTGNHEYFSGYAPWLEEVGELGLRVLQNERVDIDGLDLAGVNDVTGGQYQHGPDFGKALGDRDPAKPVVLLAHQPVQAYDAAKHEVDLQLSGHTHGGQLQPFGLVVALQQPVVSGLGTVNGTTVYVTNGAGFWGPPVRVGAPPQVSVIELRAP